MPKCIKIDGLNKDQARHICCECSASYIDSYDGCLRCSELHDGVDDIIRDFPERLFSKELVESAKESLEQELEESLKQELKVTEKCCYTCKNCLRRLDKEDSYKCFKGMINMLDIDVYKSSCTQWEPNPNFFQEDQSAKADLGKPKITKCPTDIIRAISVIREFGDRKYEPDSWKNVDPQRYRDAMMRHALLYIDDPYGLDEESGLPHLWHMACNIAFLCYFDKEQIEISMINSKEDKY